MELALTPAEQILNTEKKRFEQALYYGATVRARSKGRKSARKRDVRYVFNRLYKPTGKASRMLAAAKKQASRVPAYLQKHRLGRAIIKAVSFRRVLVSIAAFSLVYLEIHPLRHSRLDRFVHPADYLVAGYGVGQELWDRTRDLVHRPGADDQPVVPAQPSRPVAKELNRCGERMARNVRKRARQLAAADGKDGTEPTPDQIRSAWAGLGVPAAWQGHKVTAAAAAPERSIFRSVKELTLRGATIIGVAFLRGAIIIGVALAFYAIFAKVLPRLPLNHYWQIPVILASVVLLYWVLVNVPRAIKSVPRAIKAAFDGFVAFVNKLIELVDQLAKISRRIARKVQEAAGRRKGADQGVQLAPNLSRVTVSQEDLAEVLRVLRFAAGPGGGAPAEIIFGNGNRAVLVNGLGADPRELLTALGLPPGADGAGVIFVCGGADDLTGASLIRAEEVLGPAVSAAAEVTGAAVFDGGTSSGVMALTGAARAIRPGAMPVLVGVAPAGLVSYPGGPSSGDRVSLQENHSHFVLADGSEWGGETALLIGLAAAYAAGGRVVVVVAGGGRVSKAEVLASVRRGWPVFAIQDTGGVADDLARLWEAHRIPRRRPLAWLWPAKVRYRRPPPLSLIPDPDLREIVAEGDIRLVTGGEPGQLARRIAWELQDEPVLKAAWQQFATYDHLAGRLRAAFTRFQAWILLLGVLATLLGLIQARVGNEALHWTVVTIPILAAVLIAVAGRRAVGQRWVMLRAAAEAIKAEIYRYRALAAGRARGAARDKHAGRQQELAAHLDHIESRLMHTDASSGPLTPYAGPLPPQMYGAGRDDDGLSPLGADRYLQIRIGDQLAYFHGRIRTLSRRRDTFQFLAIAAGATGAILAAAGLEAWIGLTSGAAAALLAYLGYLQVDNTIVTYNQAATKLAGLDRDWRARSPAQQNLAAFKDLVAGGETVLTSELTGWVQQMSDTIQDLQRKQAQAARSIEPTAPAKPPDPTPENPS